MIKSKTNKEYISIYITNRGKKDKDMAEESLDHIDCNFSRIMGILFIPIYRIGKIILSLRKNYRHFSWHILVKDRASGNWYCSNDRIQIREIKNK